MPLPIQATQARLIIAGQEYELRDVHVSTVESMEREELRGYGGGTRVFTNGRVTSRVVINAEVLPEPEAPPPDAWNVLGSLLTDQQLRDRVTDAMAPATGDALDQLAALYGVSREPPVFAIPPSATAELIAPPEPQPPAPEPRSRWLRLMDEREIC